MTVEAISNIKKDVEELTLELTKIRLELTKINWKGYLDVTDLIEAINDIVEDVAELTLELTKLYDSRDHWKAIAEEALREAAYYHQHEA